VGTSKVSNKVYFYSYHTPSKPVKFYPVDMTNLPLDKLPDFH